MPEENKYINSDENATESGAAEIERADESVVSENASTDALNDSRDESDSVSKVSDEPVCAEGRDSSDAAPQAHIAEDGDQLTLAIPSEELRDEIEESVIDEQKNHAESFPASLLEEAPPYDEKKPRRIDGRFDFIELLIFTLAAVFVLTSFVFRHSIVDGDSMQNTLQDGEILIISGLFYTPERYDIVVLEDHSTGLDHPIVKRVIATEGEKVKITANGKIFVDGEELLDYFVFTDFGDMNNDGKDDYSYAPMEYTVPKGEIFVMGDHRNDSYDSRKFGSVPADTVLGKVLFRLYPFNRFGSVYADAEE